MVNNFASPLSILHLRTSRSDIKLLFGRQIVMKLVTNQTQKNQPKPKKTSKTHQNYLKTSKLSVISINYSKFFHVSCYHSANNLHYNLVQALKRYLKRLFCYILAFLLQQLQQSLLQQEYTIRKNNLLYSLSNRVSVISFITVSCFKYYNSEN